MSNNDTEINKFQNPQPQRIYAVGTCDGCDRSLPVVSLDGRGQHCMMCGLVMVYNELLDIKRMLTPQPHHVNEAPHSRACGIVPHDHGVLCHSNCPTCHGHNMVRRGW